MRLWFSSCVAMAVLAGCTRQDEARVTSPLAEPAPPQTIAPAPPAPAEPSADPPASRPRLAQTITLGQGAEAAYVPSPATPPAQQQQQTVIVNNNIVVGGGYGGYPAYPGYYRSTSSRTTREGFGTTARSTSWSTTGWEGARRTAAPGQTPGIGGNWAPPPSYGPATMK